LEKECLLFDMVGKFRVVSYESLRNAQGLLVKLASFVIVRQAAQATVSDA
jgi:hypothetical protein